MREIIAMVGGAGGISLDADPHVIEIAHAAQVGHRIILKAKKGSHA